MAEKTGEWDFKLGRAFAVLASGAEPEIKLIAVGVLREWVQAEIATALEAQSAQNEDRGG